GVIVIDFRVVKATGFHEELDGIGPTSSTRTPTQGSHSWTQSHDEDSLSPLSQHLVKLLVPASHAPQLGTEEFLPFLVVWGQPAGDLRRREPLADELNKALP